MDERPPDGPLHWGSALLAAVVLIALAVPVLSIAAPWSRAAKKPQPYAFTNSLTGTAIISATGVVPGQVGTGKVVISNTGKKPFKSVKLTQSKAANPFGAALEIQVLDTTTRRCIYPLPKLPKPKKGKPAPKPPKQCLTWAPWTGGSKLKNAIVTPRVGTTWKPKETHTIQVTWRIGANVPQGTTASFRLDWRASA
jgi:hypothetical protein